MTESADDKNAPSGEGARTGSACAICGKPALAAYRPFCSRRCADVDLGRWLSGTYAVPAAPETDEDGDDDELAPGDRS
jgi:endogenous inhibitor of DNA gyrase (YacG/DUF329 family)